VPLRDHLIHRIQIIRGPTGEHGTGGGLDEWGRPQAGSAATPEVLLCDARVEWDTKRVMNAEGQEAVASGVVYLPCVLMQEGEVIEDEFGPIVLHMGPQDSIVFEGRTYPLITRNRCESDDPIWGDDINRAHWEVWIA